MPAEKDCKQVTLATLVVNPAKRKERDNLQSSLRDEMCWVILTVG